MDPALADTATTPAALIEGVREARSAADMAEVAILQLAVEWAHAHPVIDEHGIEVAWQLVPSPIWQPGEYDASVADADDPEDIEWCAIPPVTWDAPAAFAAANAMSTAAGKALIRDALVLKHRLPLIWDRVQAGGVQAWRARRVAQAVLGAHADVVALLDFQVVGIIDKVGPITLARLVDEAMLRLHAEEREIEQLEHLDSRYVRLEEGSINNTGIADLYARGDWKDLHDLDQTPTALAAALKADGCEESLDVRRSMALGILADPAQAQAMLNDQDAPAPVRKQIVLYLHLSDAALYGREVIGRNQTTGQAMLAEQIRAWCSRTDTHVVIKPVIDLNDHAGTHVEAYEIPDRIKERIQLLHPQCVFPWCTTPATSCDTDHITPHSRGGETCLHNLAPLCRHHHRLKTHTSWAYRPLDPVTDPGTYVWTDPHEIVYLRTPTGTTCETGRLRGTLRPPSAPTVPSGRN